MAETQRRPVGGRKCRRRCPRFGNADRLGDFFRHCFLPAAAFLSFFGNGKNYCHPFPAPLPLAAFRQHVYRGLVCLIFYFDRTTLLFSALVSGCFLLCGILLGLFFCLWTAAGKKYKFLTLLLPLAIFLLLTAVFFPANSYIGSIPGGKDSPGKAGSYRFDHFTYGSGTDRHRKEFAAEAKLLSRTVDVRLYNDWPPHEIFWGFDENLPLNGWSGCWKEGLSPGPDSSRNHNMEYFDAVAPTSGNLASRGLSPSLWMKIFKLFYWSGTPGDI